MQRQVLVGRHDYCLGCEVVISDVCSDADCSEMFKTSWPCLSFYIAHVLKNMKSIFIEKETKMWCDCICRNRFQRANSLLESTR